MDVRVSDRCRKGMSGGQTDLVVELFKICGLRGRELEVYRLFCHIRARPRTMHDTFVWNCLCQPTKYCSRPLCVVTI